MQNKIVKVIYRKAANELCDCKVDSHAIQYVKKDIKKRGCEKFNKKHT